MASQQNHHGAVDMKLDIFECSACGSNPGCRGCRRPGDSLEGQVIISTTSPLKFGGIEMLFQGIQSAVVPVYCWENDAPAVRSAQFKDSLAMVRARDMFLDVKCDAPLDLVQRHDGEDGLKKYSFPFSFVIPSVFDDAHSKKPRLCCMLPPSFDYANSSPTRWHESPRPTLSVSYTLVARVQYRQEDDATLRCVEAKQAVILRPVSDSEPPTCIDDFPGEFVLSEATALRKHRLGTQLGALVVAGCEPPPLVYSSPGAAAGAFTECVISVAVRATSLPPGRLRNLSFGIKAAIRAKTFFSAKPMSCMPRQVDLAGESLTRLHDTVFKLGEEQRFSGLKWDCAPADDVVDGASPVPPGSSPGHGHVWRARLTLAIKPPEALPPAFCGTLIARSYSLLIIVRVSGARGKKCSLELPFQVVHQGDNARDPGTLPAPPAGRCKGPRALLGQQTELPKYDDRWTGASDRLRALS